MATYLKIVNRTELLNIVKSHEQILIFGTGIVAKNLSLFFTENGCDNFINCYVVSSFQRNPYFFLKHLVFLADEIDATQRDKYIVIASMPDKYDEITQYLSSYGYSRFVVLEEDFYKTLRYDISDSELLSYKDRIKNVYMQELQGVCKNFNYSDSHIKFRIREVFGKYSIGKYKMTRLVVMLGTKCSLRCKDCANLIPYISPQEDLPVETIINSLKQIINNCDSILRCELIGGEPFLSKNLESVLEFLLSEDKVYQIELTSNGTIFPNDRVTELLKNNRVRLLISDYKKLRNNEHVLRYLDEKGITYTRLEIENWIQSGGVHKRNRSLQEIQYLYQKCAPAFVCKTLYNGNIYSCARSAGLNILKKMEEKEYLEIDDTLTAQKLRLFFELETSMACDYCDYSVDETEWIEPAIQLADIRR